MATQVIQLTNTPNDEMLNGLVDLLDVAAPGDIQIVNDQPEVLVTIPLSTPAAFANAGFDTNGSRALWTGGDKQAVAATQTNQTAVAFNARDGNGLVVFDGSVGQSPASGEAMEFSNTTMNNGDTVRILETGSSMFKPDGS